MSARDAATAGRSLQQQGRDAEAIAYLERALMLRRRKLGPDHVKVSKLSLQLAAAYIATRQLHAAESLASAALGVRERHFGTRHPAVTPALMTLARIELATWRFDDAEKHLQRVLAIRTAKLGTVDPKLAGPLSALALAYLGQGRHRAASGTLTRLLGILDGTAAEDRPRIARRVVDLAAGYGNQGRFSDAERIFRHALALQERALALDHVQIAGTLQALAKVYVAVGRLQDAERVLRRALEIRKEARGDSHFSVGVTTARLAEVYRRQRRYAEALPLARIAVEIAEAGVGPDPVRLSNALVTLASVYRDQGRLAEARQLYARVLATTRAAPGSDQESMAKILTKSAGLEHAAGNIELAREQIERALALDDPRSVHPRRAHRLVLLSRILSSGKRGAEALEAVREASRIIRRRLEDDARIDSVGDQSVSGDSEQERRRGIFVNHVKQLEKAGADDARHAAEAFEVGQLAQASDTGRAISAMASRFADSRGRFAGVVRDYQDSVARWRALDAALLAQSGESPSSRDLETERRAQEDLVRLGERAASLRETLERDFPEYSAIAHPRPVPPEEVQALLRPDEALVSVVLGREHGYQWVIRKDRLVFRRMKGLGADAIAAMVARIRDSVAPAGLTTLADLPPFDTEAAIALYQQLLAPVEDALVGVRHLVMVPDGALNSLPLGVLVTASRGASGRLPGNYRELPWLTRRYAISVLPSAASLRALRNFAERTQAPRPFAGFGDPALKGSPGDARGVTLDSANISIADVESVRRLPPLPESAVELRSIARILGSGEESVFLGEAATEARARTLDLSSYRVIAFATHSLLGGDMAGLDEPALVMTPPRVGTPSDDGLLTMSEITEIKLNAEWVVLSACNTAGADGTVGARGLSGLARAFFFAGSRALLVSHWPVVSEAAVALTTGAFAALAADPAIGRAEALRRSMLALLDDPARTGLQHPFVWAPFSLIGEGAVRQTASAMLPVRAGAPGTDHR
jgi:CHAT domain-containing protein/lipopolysaccharide biosynthesis regulator YciM